LPTTDDVEGLIRQSAAVLAPGGMFVATFRDYVSRELRQEARFIPVRSEDARILTCFLEYSESTVTVYDLVHERVDGGWRQRLSSYRKLRLDPEWLERVCAEAGLRTIERESSAGVITFVAVREPVGGCSSWASTCGSERYRFHEEVVVCRGELFQLLRDTRRYERIWNLMTTIRTVNVTSSAMTIAAVTSPG